MKRVRGWKCVCALSGQTRSVGKLLLEARRRDFGAVPVQTAVRGEGAKSGLV